LRVARSPSRWTKVSINSVAASASRLPCKNNIGILISNRWAPRSSDGRPAGCSGKPRNTRPCPPGNGDALRLRRHAPTKGFSTRDQRQTWAVLRGCSDGSTHGGMRDPRRIGPLALLFHIGELIAQRGDVALGKTCGHRRHECMRHAGAGAMGEHKAGARLRGLRQQRRHHTCASGFDLQLSVVHGVTIVWRER